MGHVWGVAGSCYESECKVTLMTFFGRAASPGSRRGRGAVRLSGSRERTVNSAAGEKRSLVALVWRRTQEEGGE